MIRRLLILLFLWPASAWAENRIIPCVSGGKTTFLLVRTYTSRFLSSFVSVGGINNYRWERDEQPSEDGAIKLTSRGAFGLGPNKFLFIDYDLLYGQNSGVAIEVLGDGAMRVFECSAEPSQVASGQ